jgi:colanic acid/amylovoran biosynthesis glycosyltransferase
MTTARPNTVCIWREELLPGSETFILNQARALRRWSARLSGLRGCSGGLDVDPDFTLETNGSILARVNRRLYRQAGTTPRLHRYLGSASVVHAHFGPDGARLARATRLARRPLVVTFHGYDATIPASTLGIDYSGLFREAARFVAVSEFIGRKLVDAGAPSEKVAVVPIGIPLIGDSPRASTGEHLLFVGRLVPKKGCGDLLEALAGIPDPPRLVVIGDGPLREDLERRAERLRVNAIFLGARDPGFVAKAMAASIAVCVPSQTAPNGDQEGLPTVLLEAAAARLPVVGYVSAGIPEAVVHGETGLLAPEGDIEMLARHVSRVAADLRLASRLGAAGRQRAELYFDITKRTSELERLYDEVAQDLTNGTGAVRNQ